MRSCIASDTRTQAHFAGCSSVEQASRRSSIARDSACANAQNEVHSGHFGSPSLRMPVDVVPQARRLPIIPCIDTRPADPV